MVSATQSDLVAVVPKNKTEEIRVSIDLFNGCRVFNARIFYDAEDGTKRPGKGIAFKVDKLEEFVKAAIDALELAMAKGYVK
ncbi:hypothetical protein HB777_29465 [Mesorhizobium loti]|nr:hypothetical protein HB777_29465 [Mesorhizobium loti]